MWKSSKFIVSKWIIKPKLQNLFHFRCTWDKDTSWWFSEWVQYHRGLRCLLWMLVGKFSFQFWLWKLYLKGECKSCSYIHCLASQCRYCATVFLFTNFYIAFQNQKVFQDKAKGIIISGHSLAVQVCLRFAKDNFVRGIQRQKVGEYSCTPTNDYGKHRSKTIDLDVKCKHI